MTTAAPGRRLLDPSGPSLARLIPLFILLMPLIEIAGFILVGSEIGVLATIALILGSTILGGMLMRIQGLGALSRIRAEMERGNVPDRELVHGLMIMVAGILLVLPGFLSDILGLALFIPAVRNLAWRFLRGRIVVVSSGTRTGAGGGWGERPRTIDLDEDEFSRRAGERNDPQDPRRIDRSP